MPDPSIPTAPLPQPHGLLGLLVGLIASFLLFLRSVRAFLGITGLLDWIRQAFWDKFFAKRAKDRQKEVEKCATVGEVKILETSIATVNTNLSARMGELGNVVHAVATNLNDTASKLTDKLQLLDQSNDQHLDELYGKLNGTREEMARIGQKVDDLPKMIVGELVTMGLLVPKAPATPDPSAPQAKAS